MIIIINGSLGVGKTSVAEHLHWKFDRSVYLDGDAIGEVNPFEIYDENRINHLYRTLALLVDFHQQNGYPNCVINYVFEAHESLQHLLDLLSPIDPDIHVFRLTCDPAEQARRIRGRQRDQLDWELERYLELNRIQAAAAQRGFIGAEVDTSGLTQEQVADQIWARLPHGITYRRLHRDEISQFHQIDRTELIEHIYYLREGQLVLENEVHHVPEWSPESKQRRIASLETCFDQGASFFSAWEGTALAGISVLGHQPVATGQKRLNLEGLWVSSPYRGLGVGRALFALAVGEARQLGAETMYVSATPSDHTVHFYQRLGCRLADPIDPALYEQEPEDIHLELILSK